MSNILNFVMLFIMSVPRRKFQDFPFGQDTDLDQSFEWPTQRIYESRDSLPL